MARPERHDADYFPFYVKDGKTLFILESKYGLQGIGFFTNLMRFLTRQTDHHICIQDEANRLYFFAQIHCPEDIGMDMISLMVKTGKIDADLWNKHRVIVSHDLLESLNDAYRNRKNEIVTLEEIGVSYINNPITSEVTPLNPEIEGRNPQRKGKERKGKETTYDKGFLAFWETYPKKAGKIAAWKAWKNQNNNRPEIEIILSAIKTQSQCEQWRKENGQYIPNPATWINQGRWEDEPIKDTPSTQNRQGRQSLSPYKTCERCGQEYLEADAIEIKGQMRCPKCPEAREESERLAKVGYGKVIEELEQRQAARESP